MTITKEAEETKRRNGPVATQSGFAVAPFLPVALFVLLTLTAAAAESWNNPPKARFPGVQHATFRSASMNVLVGFNVYLPPAYATENTNRFPVIYYLHGIKGDESSYLDYAALLHKAIENRSVHPMILVFANGGATSFFSDSPDESIKGEAVVMRELIPHLDGHYRTIASASGRALHGFSMGGFGALKLAFKYPDEFSAVVSYDALLSDARQFRDREKKLFAKMFRDEAGFSKNDPFQLLQQNASKIQKLAIQIVASDDESEILQGNRNLHSALDRLHVQHEFRELKSTSHKKESIYEKAALGAFQFTDRAFAASTRH